MPRKRSSLGVDVGGDGEVVDMDGAAAQEGDSERDEDREDRDSDYPEDSSGQSGDESSSGTEGQDRGTRRSDSVGSANSAGNKDRAPELLKPMPLWDDGTEEQHFTIDVQSGTGWRIQMPGPQHNFCCPNKEPLGTRLQDVSHNGLKDNSKYDVMSKEMQALDELRTGEGQVVYLRDAVNFSDPFQPFYALQGSEDLTLQFESRFESGNLSQAAKVAETEYDLEMSKDYNTGGHTQWFYFQVKNARKGVPYKFNLINFYKSNSLYNSGLRPLLYSEHRANKGDGIGWYRAGERICYYKSSRKRKEGKPKKTKSAIPGTPEEEKKKTTRDKFWFTLTFTMTFPHDNDACYIAHCYPFTFSDCRRHISSLFNLEGSLSQSIRRRVLCKTLAGNNCEVLTITSPSADPNELKARKVIAIAGRVHPGECNASWMMKGFLDALLDGSDVANRLLSSFVFKVIPMLNPDGVVVGNYRCALSGHDLNRRWRRPDEEYHPTIHSAKAMLERAAKERGVLLFVDLHGHSRRSNIFSYGCDSRYWKADARDTARTHDQRSRPYLERVFPAYLSMHSRSFDLRSCTFGVSRAKEGCSRVVAWRLLTRSAYTVEASFCGPDQGELKGLHLNMKHLEEFGRDLCVTIDKVFRVPKKRDGSLIPGVGLSRAAEKMEAKMARAMERKEKGGKDAVDVSDSDASDSDEEDEDEKKARALFKQAIMGAVACEGSDDDTSSEDEAILNPKKVVHELQKSKRSSTSKRRKKKDADGKDKEENDAAKKESGPEKGVKEGEEEKKKAAAAPTPKREDAGRRKDDSRRKAEEAAAQKLGALLSNAEQMLAVAQEKSASHPPECECLLCRAPMLLNAGESLLGKMKGGKEGSSGSGRGWASAAGATAAAGPAAVSGGMRGLKKTGSLKKMGSTAGMGGGAEGKTGSPPRGIREGLAERRVMQEATPLVSLGALPSSAQATSPARDREGGAAEYGRLRRVVQSREFGRAGASGRAPRTQEVSRRDVTVEAERGERGRGTIPGHVVRQESQVMRAAQTVVQGGFAGNVGQMRRAIEAEALGGGRSSSGGPRGKEMGMAGSVEGMMGIFSGGKVNQTRVGSYKEGKVLANIGELRRREQLSKAASGSKGSGVLLPDTAAPPSRSTVLSRGGWRKLSPSQPPPPSSVSPTRDPLMRAGPSPASDLVGGAKYYGQSPTGRTANL